MQSLYGGAEEQKAVQRAWHPLLQGNIDNGYRLFDIYCSTCHQPNGTSQATWGTSFKRLPPDLQAGPFLYLSPTESTKEQRERIARIVKFGISGTDMPGHEYLPDQQIASISLWLAQNLAKPALTLQLSHSLEKPNENP